MRRSLALPLVVLIGVASAASIAMAAAATETPTEEAPDAVTAGERYGIVRYDSAAGQWAIMSTRTFKGSGLDRVSCAPGNGVLTVEFSPLANVGTFSVDEDDAYAGRYAAGAKATTRSLAITFRKVGSGAVVPCNAAELRVANSSLQLAVRGDNIAPTPSAEPSGPPPISPDPSPSISVSPSDDGATPTPTFSSR